MATGFGELAAIALQNSRNLDERIIAEQHREKSKLSLFMFLYIDIHVLIQVDLQNWEQHPH
jgi:hypothetical protein